MGLPKVIERFGGKHEWLSNFYAVPVKFAGDEYPSVEHAYQAAKTFDPRERKEFRAGITAGDAKRLGRAVKKRADWDEVKVSVMRDLLCEKFAHPHMRERLLSTGSARLVEGNWWGDTFWGVCGGVGKNMLGELLMEERARLRLIHG